MSVNENKPTAYSVFDKMLNPDTVNAFLRRKESSYNVSSEEYDQISNYVTSPEYFDWVDWSFEVLTGSESLSRLDACAQDCIRIVGSGGKRTNAKYRVRYKDMKCMGYQTLVHAFGAVWTICFLTRAANFPPFFMSSS